MRLLDERYTACPFYGSRRMTAWLIGRGEVVDRKRMMGLEAIFPKPRLSMAGKNNCR
jgi:putative transposase